MSYTTDLLQALGVLRARKSLVASKDPAVAAWATSSWNSPDTIQSQYDRVLESSVNGDEYAKPWRLTQAQFAERWVRFGLPRIEMSHGLAASLMATAIPDASAESLVVPPWGAFLIEVPSGLLPMENSDGAFGSAELVLVNVYEWKDRPNRTWIWTVTGHDKQRGGAIVSGRLLSPTSDEVDVEVYMPGVGCGGVPKGAFRENAAVLGPLQRLLESARRLIVGCCIRMSDPQNFVHAGKPKNGGGKRDWRGSPTPTRFDTYRLIGDVKVDVRKAVSEYVRHGGKSPTVQSMVRGHWKHQTHGAGRALRKLIHVEPYWRGPEDAPIALRSHVVEDK